MFKTSNGLERWKRQMKRLVYVMLDTEQGEKDKVESMCSRLGVLRTEKETSEESVLRRWKKYFKELMNKVNERGGWVEDRECQGSCEEDEG